jgi:hypothetical protein
MAFRSGLLIDRSHISLEVRKNRNASVATISAAPAKYSRAACDLSASARAPARTASAIPAAATIACR